MMTETIYIYPEKIPVCHHCIESLHTFKTKLSCDKCDKPTFYKMKFTHVNSLVSLKSFYDMGRLPLHLGGGYGRVTWTALAGSKWIDFKIWNDFRWEVLNRDNGICQMCKKQVTTKDSSGRWQFVTFVCDHIVPLFKGGRDWWEDKEMVNFQTLCEDCNKIKTRYDVAKAHVIKQKLDLKVVQYAGFVFEQIAPTNHQLDKFFASNHSK
jgi:hypothetical protein